MPEPSPTTTTTTTDIDEFAHALSNFDKLKDPFELVGIYRSCSAKQAIRLSEEEEEGEEEEDIEQQIQDWELEAQTWELIEILYEHRLTAESRRFAQDEDDKDKRLTNAAMEQIFYESNPEARELLLIIDWIRKSLPMPVEPELRGSKWQYTRNLIRQKEINQISTRSIFGDQQQQQQEIITDLDMDAPIRQERLSLSPADIEYDLRIYKYIFELMQIGEFNQAQKVCKDTGNLTLKITMNGMIEYRNSKLDGFSIDGDEIKPYGTRNKKLWRHMCGKVSKTNKISKIERGIYGIMSCDVDSVVALCDTWLTQLLAYVNNLTVINLDEFINGTRNYKKIGEILDLLSNSSSPIIKSQSQDPFRVFEGSIMNNGIEQLIMDAASKSIDDDDDNLLFESPHFLRFLVHAVLFLHSIDAIDNTNDIKVIVSTYIEYLSMIGKDDLIPLYSSQLQDNDAYSFFLAGIFSLGDDEIRNRQFKLANQYGIDIQSVLSQSMEKLFNEQEKMTNIQDDDEQEQEAVDMRLVAGIEWLLQAGMNNEALDATIEIFNRVLKRKNVNIALELYGLFMPKYNNNQQECYKLSEYSRLLETIDGINKWDRIFKEKNQYTSNIAWKNLAKREFDNLRIKATDIIYNEWFDNGNQQEQELKEMYIPYIIINYQRSIYQASCSLSSDDDDGIIKCGMDLIILVSGDKVINSLMVNSITQYLEIVGQCLVEASRYDAIYV